MNPLYAAAMKVAEDKIAAKLSSDQALTVQESQYIYMVNKIFAHSFQTFLNHIEFLHSAIKQNGFTVDHSLDQFNQAFNADMEKAYEFYYKQTHKIERPEVSGVCED